MTQKVLHTLQLDDEELAVCNKIGQYWLAATSEMKFTLTAQENEALYRVIEKVIRLGATMQ